MEGEMAKIKLKAEEVARAVKEAVYEALKKARFVAIELEEEGKVRICKGNEVLLEIEVENVSNILGFTGGTAIESVIEAVEKVLKEKFKLKETDYEIEVLEPRIEKYGQYGEWVWDYIDVKLGDGIEFDKEYSTSLFSGRKEYISIYYSDVTRKWHIEVGGILTEMYRKSSESSIVLLTEDQIKELGLNPSNFEPYF